MSQNPDALRVAGGGMADTYPFSPGLVVGDLVFVSGMTGLDPAFPADLERVPDNLAGQFGRAMSSIEEILRTVGARLSDVVSVRAYLPQIERDFAEFNGIYRQWFTDVPLPVRTTIGATLAVPILLVEIDVIARVPRDA